MARLRSISTTSSNHKTRRAAPALAAALLLAGCSSIGRGDVSSVYAIAHGLWGTGQKVTLEEAASVPYASMGIRLGDGTETMIILAGDTGGQNLWTSSAKIAITTSDGRIVRTAGFEHNLGGYEPRGDSSSENGGRTVRWQADFPDLNLYSVPIACQDRQAGNETIVILGADIHTRRIEESCASAGSRLDWSFKNTYWVDPDSGVVWRSIQHVHPQLDAIETEILRPPA
jgi:hypothetical protein